MARYIDADALYKATQKRIAEANEARMAVVDDEFLDLINDAFTEDVAPRAEIAREIFEKMDEIMLPLLHEVSQVYIYVKLKRKYTQSEPPEGDES